MMLGVSGVVELESMVDVGVGWTWGWLDSGWEVGLIVVGVLEGVS